MNMKKIYLLLLIFLFANIVEAKTIVEYESCVDGDTIWVKKDEKSIKVRLLSINAPEISHDDQPADYMGEESKNYICNLLEKASKIELEYDDNSKQEDKYGRTLAWIWIDDRLLQELMVEEGLAKVEYVYKEYEYSNYLCEVEDKAINNKKGIWQQEEKRAYCQNRELLQEEKKEEKKEESEEDIIITNNMIVIAFTIVAIFLMISAVIYAKNIKKN